MTIHSNLPHYGRKYKITIELESGDVLDVSDSDFEPNSIRVTFVISTLAFQNAWWYAEIDIYNLDQQTTQLLLVRPIKQGMIVTVAAGYVEPGDYDVIWRGPVFQPTFSRENTVDFKISLHCVLGLQEFVREKINGAYAAETTQYDIINSIANGQFSKTGAKIQQHYISPDFQKIKSPRGGVVFGAPSKYIGLAAESLNKAWWFGKDGIDVGGLDETTPTSGVDFVYTPQNGLIGVPSQTQYGIRFRTLLDPRLQVRIPLPVVKLDQTSIRLMKRQLGELYGLLDQDGEYGVTAVRHIGDTRGTEWYSEVDGVTMVGGKLSMGQGFLSALAKG